MGCLTTERPRWTNNTVRHSIRNPIYQGIDRYRVRSWVGEPGNKRLKFNPDSQVIKGYREDHVGTGFTVIWPLRSGARSSRGS
ncbi:MAG: recombinase family protein [Acidobacteriota bacterium]|nr:recombinase family protein [Acidobacteriota bacterium]